MQRLAYAFCSFMIFTLGENVNNKAKMYEPNTRENVYFPGQGKPIVGPLCKHFRTVQRYWHNTIYCILIHIRKL
jgi:hypothetical protein